MKTNSVSTFNHELFGDIRITDRDGEPWFVAKDICDALSHSNSRKALERLDSDEKGVTTSDTLGGAQSVNVVNESGLYHLILSSRKPEAKAFRKWVTGEVLPAIRKTGTYRSAPAPLGTPADILMRKMEEFEITDTNDLVTFEGMALLHQKLSNLSSAKTAPTATHHHHQISVAEEQSDPERLLFDFASEMFTHQTGNYLRVSDAYRAYFKFCDARRVLPYYESVNTLSKALRNINPTRFRKSKRVLFEDGSREVCFQDLVVKS